MLLQVNLFQVNNAEPAWKIWKNQYWFEVDSMPDIQNGYNLFLPLMQWQAWSLKTSCQMSLCTWHPLIYGLEAAKAPAGNATIMRLNEQNGTMTIQGQMRFMQGLRWRLESHRGPSGRSIWHGCLDESNLIHPQRGRIGLGNVKLYEELNRELHLINKESLWDKQMRVAGGGGVLAAYTEKKAVATTGPYYSEMHAMTRWLRRLRGKGFDTYGQIFDVIRGLVAMWWIFDGIIKDGGYFTFATQYYPMIAALNGVDVAAKKIKAYLTDADEKSENGEVPPQVRYGITSEAVATAWETVGAKIKKSTEEAQKLYRPHTDRSGDEYMFLEYFPPYQDLAAEAISQLSSTLSWDWSNFKAYPNQQDRATMNGCRMR